MISSRKQDTKQCSKSLTEENVNSNKDISRQLYVTVTDETAQKEIANHLQNGTELFVDKGKIYQVIL